MKIRLAPFFKAKVFILLLIASNSANSQKSDHVLFEFTSSTVTFRMFNSVTKQAENLLPYYSEKHKRLLFDKTDFEMYPDSNYYLVKARIKVQSIKGFKDTPEKEETEIGVKYYYFKTNPETSKMEEFVIWRHLGASHYPRASFIRNVIQKDQGDIRFVIDDSRQWLLQNNGKPDDAILYMEENKTLPFLSYVIIFNDLKRVVVNGEKLNN